MEKIQQTEREPILAPPGAGLPLTQRFFIRVWVGPVVSKITSPTQSRKTYESLTNKLIEIVSKIPLESRKIKVLVDPILGLEDSSRYWSINGVLEHILIVSKSIESIIFSLSSGKVPDGMADVAKAKPKQIDTAIISDFCNYAPDLMKRIDDKLCLPGLNFRSPEKFRHPWFGLLSARQWYWLLSSHQGIHYQQAKAIIRKLPIEQAD